MDVFSKFKKKKLSLVIDTYVIHIAAFISGLLRRPIIGNN